MSRPYDKLDVPMTMSENEQDEPEIVDPYVGTLVQDKYRFVRKLGEGGMGAVYEGENVAIKRRVAIKCLHAHLARNASVVYRFRNEALAATQIGNEHIVDVLDMGQLPNGAFFLVLEFLDGTDLAGLLAREPILSVGRAVQITQQVLDALGAAHEAKIIHRDIKPENVFLVRRSQQAEFVKLLDFGIAKVASDDPAIRTATGSQLGTPYYMAPEQALGVRDLDARADLYATAVMLYHCLTGRYPFEADSLPMLMYNICHSEAASIVEHRPDLPGELSALIMRALSKNRDERPQTAAEFSSKLEPFRSLALLPATPPAPAPDASRAAAPSGPASAPKSHTTLGASASAVDLEQKLRPAPAARLPMALGAITVAALAIAGTTVALSRRSTTTELRAPPTPPAVEQRATAAPPPAQPTIATPTPALARRVAVQIEATPASATLTIDGRPLNNPYDGEIEASDAVRELVISAAGYRTEVRRIVLNERQRIPITLQRGAGRVVVASAPTAARAETTAPSRAPTPNANPSTNAPATQTNTAQTPTSPTASEPRAQAPRNDTPAGLRAPEEI